MTFEGEGCPPVIRSSRMKRAAKIAIPSAAALGAGAVVATAAIPAADGTITACYQSGAVGARGSSVRFVDDGSACNTNSGETALSWNQRGLPGPAGPQGDQGPAGPAGAPGGSSGGGSPAFAAAASNYLLEIDGIKGESQDNKHPGTIVVESFSFGESQTTHSSGGGGGAGKVKFHDISVKKQVDSASPSLFQHCATGEHIKKAVLYVRKAGGSQTEYLKITLTDVLVSSYNVGSQAPKGAGETESITLNFAKIQQTYTPTNANGTPGAAQVAGWDVKANKKI
jgi:type VI secretion system secreted protein Hcp